MGNMSFNMMSLFFKIRDLFSPPEKTVGEVGIKPGDNVLDYGCGPGSYAIAAADLVGDSGKVYAVDVHPLALRRVAAAASKKNLHNVETILTDCPTDLEAESIDAALLYDTYHDLGDPLGVMKELHRILKPGSILSFSDHHMKAEEVVPEVERSGLFRLLKKSEKSFLFGRI